MTGYDSKRKMAADKLQEPAQEPVKLWLWKNFVDGKPEYWAFDNPFPIFMDSHDPQTLGEPCGYAWFKPSRAGRTDVSDKQVLQDVQEALSKPAQEPDMLVIAYQSGYYDGKKAALAQPVQKPINLLEARKIAAEYGTPDSQIDSGNLYFALSKCLEHIDAQPAQDESELLTIAYQSGYHDGKQAALAGREWNFCERCGKRTADLTIIHTCTPPQGDA